MRDDDKRFTIKRNGAVIELTLQEQEDLKNHWLASIGKECLIIKRGKFMDDEENHSILSKLDEWIEDEQMCLTIEEEVLNRAFSDVAKIESEVIENFLDDELKRKADERI